ncbi:MAG: GldG family protein [Deltaproteobacteria bacterium]|nr:GldG family protein [Deltaproteobacteria bacterium]MBW2052212.1 GldG family protein [Deltaproteobacteria bacterium]MBW2139505.1 GldG family protein [Deltaproteobacteria bacterium]MBW2322546.1 GldG family protein [Deltaproteobacteria bacterium]
MSRVRSFLIAVRTLAVILGAVSIFAAALVRFFLPELTNSALGLVIMGAALILIFCLGSLSEIKTFLFSKQGRYSVNTTIMIAVFVAILILANFFGLTNHRRFDVTASSKFTLATQTQRVIKELKQPVQVIGFFPEVANLRAAKEAARNLLDEYRYFNRKLSYKFVDPDAKPGLAKQYRVQYNGSLVFLSRERQKIVLIPNEQNFTGALLEVTGVKAKKVYFLSGHGERDINNVRETGYSVARMGLIRDLYKVDSLNLTLNPQVPQDCAVLVIAGPKKALPKAETEAILNYLKGNGKVLLLADPNPPAEVNEILATWGIAVGRGRIVDKIAYVSPDKTTPAVFRDKYPPVVVTAGLDTTYFPEASSVVLTKELKRVIDSMKEQAKGQEKQPEWPLSPAQYGSLVVLPAILTTESSWLETDSKEERFDKDTDVQGPLALGILMIASAPLSEEAPAKKQGEEKLTRIVILGDSDFASNQHIQNGGNGDLFLNSVNWLAEEEHLIYVRPKPFTFRRLVISKDASRFIRFSSVALLPFLLVVLSAIIWIRKR